MEPMQTIPVTILFGYTDAANDGGHRTCGDSLALCQVTADSRLLVLVLVKK